MTLANRIRDARNRKGWTQTDLADATGSAQNRISDLERGATTDPKMETIIALAEALDVTADYLLGLTDRT